MTLTFYYVRHADVPAYQALGWTRLNDLDGTHHGYHACLMRWDGEGEPVIP